MRRKRHAATDDSDLDLTPMLDVVFIMLIFFIVTATFIKESGIDVTKPDADTALVQERANIVVGVTETGQVWINRQQVDIRAVRARIEQLHAENPRGTVVIDADIKADHGIVMDVLDAAGLAGVPASFAARGDG